MDVQVGSHGTTGAEEEDAVQDIQHKWDDWVTGETVVECDRKQVEQAEHGEDREEHVEIDDGWVTGEREVNDVAGKAHDENGPYELHLGSVQFLNSSLSMNSPQTPGG